MYTNSIIYIYQWIVNLRNIFGNTNLGCLCVVQYYNKILNSTHTEKPRNFTMMKHIFSLFLRCREKRSF